MSTFDIVNEVTGEKYGTVEAPDVATAAENAGDELDVPYENVVALLSDRPAPDYADAIAERIKGAWLTSTTDTRDVQQLIAAGVRKGYTLGFGAAS